MPKFSWVYFAAPWIFLFLIQTVSKKVDPSLVKPSAFAKQLSLLDSTRKDISPELILLEIERLDREINMKAYSPTPEELIRFFVIYMEVLGENNQAQKGIELALDVLKNDNQKGWESIDWADFYASLGLLYDAVGQTLKAVQAYEKAVQAYESQQDVDYPSLALTLKNLGYAYYTLNFQNKTAFNYYKALDIAKDHSYSDYEDMTQFVFNLFYVEYEYGNEQGMRDLVEFFEGYIQDAEESDTLSMDQINRMKIHQFLNKARFFETLHDAEKTIELVATVEHFLANVDSDFRKSHQDYQLAVYESAGAVFKYLERFEESRQYYDRMLRVPLSDFYQMKYTANMAMVNYFAKDYSESLTKADQSLKKLEEMGYKGSSIQTLMILKADLLSKLGKQPEARTLITRIFSDLLSKPFTEEDLGRLSYREFNGANSDRYITILIRSGNMYRDFFREKSQKEDFDRAYNFYRLAAEMFQQYYLKGTYNSWLETLNREIEGGVLSVLTDPVLVTEDSIISSINLLEQNSSQQLWKRFLSKNEELLGKTAEMITEVNLRQLELEGLGDSDSTASEKEELERTLRQIEQEIAVDPTVEFYSAQGFDLGQFRQSLPRGEQVIKFYVTDLDVFGLYVSSETLRVRKLGTVKGLEDKVRRYREAVLKIKPDYEVLSRELHLDLIAPFLAESAERLQIIPDDFLHLLPFEGLKDADGNFLVSNTAVAYQHSFNLLGYQSPAQSRFNPDFMIGFAPSYEGTRFSAIKNNVEETLQIVDYHSSEGKVGQEASRRNFVASLADYRIHHLAMHTEQEESNYERSALVFANEERLKVDELYRMNFPSELVVLSACNTGVGQLQPGEGLSSLARALTFAGVKSSVYSLWEVPDKETSELMIFFYEEIKKGLPKDHALAAAKRRFLETYPLKNHPIFWAGFVINGQLDPVKTGRIPTSWILGILGGLLLVGAGVWAWKKSRN